MCVCGLGYREKKLRSEPLGIQASSYYFLPKGIRTNYVSECYNDDYGTDLVGQHALI